MGLPDATSVGPSPLQPIRMMVTAANPAAKSFLFSYDSPSRVSIMSGIEDCLFISSIHKISTNLVWDCCDDTSNAGFTEY